MEAITNCDAAPNLEVARADCRMCPCCGRGPLVSHKYCLWCEAHLRGYHTRFHGTCYLCWERQTQALGQQESAA